MKKDLMSLGLFITTVLLFIYYQDVPPNYHISIWRKKANIRIQLFEFVGEGLFGQNVESKGVKSFKLNQVKIQGVNDNICCNTRQEDLTAVIPNLGSSSVLFFHDDDEDEDESCCHSINVELITKAESMGFLAILVQNDEDSTFIPKDDELLLNDFSHTIPIFYIAKSFGQSINNLLINQAREDEKEKGIEYLLNLKSAKSYEPNKYKRTNY